MAASQEPALDIVGDLIVTDCTPSCLCHGLNTSVRLGDGPRLGTLTGMSDVDSPVLRLIPYLAAFTVTVFVTIPVFGGGQLLMALVVAVIAYFGTYYLVQYVIGLVVRHRRNNTDDLE